MADMVYVDDYVLLSIIFVASIWILSGNVALIIILTRSKLLMPAHRILRTTLAILDIAICSSSVIGIPWIIIEGTNIPLLMCNVLTIIGVTAYFVVINITTLIAGERYLYLCKPLFYEKHVSKSKTITAITVFVCIPLGIVIYNRIQYTSTVLIRELQCGTGGKGVILTIVSVLPSAICTLFCILKLRKEIVDKTTHMKLHIVGIGAAKQLKLVMLLSGTLWFSVIPNWIIKIALLQAFSIPEIGEHDFISIIYRLNSILLIFLTSALNPILQFTVESDLRVGFWRLLGKQVDYNWQKELKHSFTSFTTRTNDKQSCNQ